jgi:hypothetical protein
MDYSNNIEFAKELIAKYPFLIPRNVFTDKIPDNYDYTYVRGIGELPSGWHRLFLQMCHDLREQLIKDNQLESFRFTQIKEKYNRMVCYNNGCSEEAQKIIDKYEHMAMYICTVCGKPATLETNGYIASYCDECYNKLQYKAYKADRLTLETSYKIIRFTRDGKSEEIISFEEEWNRYNA